MLNYVLTYVTLLVLYLLQTTLGIYIDIFDIAPNILLVFAVCYSVYNYPVRSSIMCLVAGIMVDLYSQPYIGLNALLFMYTGLAISTFASSLVKKNLWTVAVGVLVVSIIYHLVILMVNYVIPGYSEFAYPVARYVAPTALYDGVMAFVIAWWAKWLSEDRIRGL